MLNLSKNRYLKHARISEGIFRKVLKMFRADIPALTADGLAGLSVQSTPRLYDGLRLRIMELTLEEARPVRRVWRRRICSLRRRVGLLRSSASANHTITLEVARDTQALQDAVDRELVRRYQPGHPRVGLLVQIAQRIHRLQDIAERNRHDLPLTAMSAVSEPIPFPADIWPLADEQLKELGYGTLSAYITGLIRDDLLVGGPHTYATGEVRSKVQRAITRKTVVARLKSGQRKILLNHLIERALGHRVP